MRKSTRITPGPGSNAGAVATGIDERLPDLCRWVSNQSQWTDRKWILDGKTVGAGSSTVTCIWDFPLSDGTTLLDDPHQALLNESRCFLWSLYSDRSEGRTLKSSGIGMVFHGLRRIIRWMVEHNYASFGELDNRASLRYCDWLVELFAAPPKVQKNQDSGTVSEELSEFGECIESDDDFIEMGEAKIWRQANDEEIDPDDVGGVSPGTISNCLATWRYLWEQRSPMERLGLVGLRQEPFSGRSVHVLAVELATKVTQSIPAIPDTVAIAILNEAHRFIALTADDVIRAVRGLFQIRDEMPNAKKFSPSTSPSVKTFLEDFRFSTPAHANCPWHHPMGSMGTSSVEELRRLIDDLVDACTITTQAETGMRISEISNLPAGENLETGLPACITKKISKSGMLDLYYIKSKLTKLRRSPVEEEWLLAAAPRGTKELPDAVRAVVVLQQLLAPIRALATTEIGEYLLVTLGVPRSLPSSANGVTEPSNHLIRTGQKSFARSFVDWEQIPLTDETRPYKVSRGNCIRTHQWRKTYAQYVFQVDSRLLPAIARQFKHLSLAMTEGAYVGTNFSLVTGVAEHNRNLAADVFFAKIRGTPVKQEGRLSKLMDKYRDELLTIVEGLNSGEARAAVDAWCRNRDMKIFFHGYGNCIPSIAPTKAECHKRGHTVHWANSAPNFAMREPSVCTGCYLFMAGEEHIEHWRSRYIENMTTWRKARSEGRGNDFRVVRARAEQAESYLINLGVEVPKLEAFDAG